MNARTRKPFSRKMNERGFTLVEAMMVVGIASVLAAIAASNYTHYKNLARQAEAKSNLAALYTAQQGFSAQWGGYTGDFRDLGISYSGALNYDVGFEGPGWMPSDPGFTPSSSGGCAAGSASNTKSMCGKDLGSISMTGSGGFANAPAGGGCGGGANPSSSGFRATASGSLAGGGGSDVWTMDNNKRLCNNVAGGGSGSSGGGSMIDEDDVAAAAAAAASKSAAIP